MPRYRCCMVPQCTNTSISTPKKTFIQVPAEEKRKKKWFCAARRDYEAVSEKTLFYVCEDHFDLENDMQNYMKWKLVGGLKFMKNTAVPHKFDCQPDRKMAFANVPQSTALKRKMQLVEKAISQKTSKIVTTTTSTCIEEHTQEINELLEQEYSEITLKTKDVGITVKPHFRSKPTQTLIHSASKSCPLLKITTYVATSPLRINTSHSKS